MFLGHTFWLDYRKGQTNPGAQTLLKDPEEASEL